MKFTVYCITNNINFKSYIGFTSKTSENRWKEHIRLSANGSNTHLHNAIRKYGQNNFVLTTLAIVSNERDAKCLEKQFICKYDTFNCGYNLTLGGDGTCGYKHTTEAKIKIGLASLGNKHAKGPVPGFKHSRESKNKMSASHKGKKKPWVIARNKKTAKTYEIIFPDNRVQIITNLNQFCFKYNLHTGSMSLVSRGLQTHHKSFRCKLIKP